MSADFVRDQPPFRADHVGSLLRPERLLRARDEHAAGDLPDDELRRIEDESIADVVRMQQDVGLRTATDGEFRRSSWHMDFIYQLDGITKTKGDIAVHFHGEQGDIDFTPSGLQVDGKIAVDTPIFAGHLEYLQSLTQGTQSPAELPIPAPTIAP